MSKPEIPAFMLELGAKLFPRRYRRFRDLRPYQEACEWARTLDWRQNPYARYLLRRELLLHLESTECYGGSRNIFTFVSREEIAAEVDRLIDEFPERYDSMGVFSYVVLTAPGNLSCRHGWISYNRLTQALATLP